MASKHPPSRPIAPGGGLRLDFDFGNVAGYAFARRELPLELPENYELSFYLRANAPINNFQVKLADSSGDNVWWFQCPDFVFPTLGAASDKEETDRVRLGTGSGPRASTLR